MDEREFGSTDGSFLEASVEICSQTNALMQISGYSSVPIQLVVWFILLHRAGYLFTRSRNKQIKAENKGSADLQNYKLMWHLN